MNGKIVAAFLAGAVLASGIVYMAVRPDAAPVTKPVTVATVRTQPAPPPAPPEEAKEPLPPISAEIPDEPKEPAKSRPALPRAKTLMPIAPIREKPSPMPPAVRREKQEVAQNTPVLAPAPPTVLTEPINKERPYNDARPADPPPAPEPPRAVPTAPEPVLQPEPTPAPPAPVAARVPNVVTLAAGTLLFVRVGETISAAHYKTGDSFMATLDRPLVIEGFVIAERGSRVEGRVVQAGAASWTNGGSRLGIELVKLSTSDGQHIQIRTSPYNKDGSGSTGKDIAKMGAGAAIGAGIGAAAGGGKGAAIGAGAGTAAGAADVLLTRNRTAEIPVETRLSFRVEAPVTITERLN